MTDGQGHIVDRISEIYASHIPFEFELGNYCNISASDFARKSQEFDIVHFNNWDVSRQAGVLSLIKVPMIMTVRSFRYADSVRLSLPFFKRVVVIHPELMSHFKNSVYIPDGVSDAFDNRKFVVGCAYQKMGTNDDYKGINLIRQACEILGCEFRPVSNVPFDQMSEYYKGLDLYICASENEGFGAPVAECMRMNIPVITTNVGIAKYFPVQKIDRTVEGILSGISKFYTNPQVAGYNWHTVSGAMRRVYEEVYAGKK